MVTAMEKKRVDIMIIRAITLLVSLLLVLCNDAAYARTFQVIRVSANKIIASQYRDWVGDAPPWEITDFSYKDSHRGTIELILMSKALMIGGIDAEISFVKAPNYTRALIQASKGKADLPAETIWKPEVDRKFFYITDPVFRKGEIELGVYVLPSNSKILEVDALNELQKFSAVSSSNWLMNWGTLLEMGITRHNAPRIELMYKMVEAGRVDFYLTSFTRKEDFSSEQAGVRLIPIPNIKVGLNNSRHFAVSKASPHGERIFEALQKGLKILRKKGVIRKAFEQSGYLDARVKNWKRIYP